MVTVESNAKKVSDSFKKLSDTLYNAIVKDGIWEYLVTLRQGAKTVHRHKRKTGKLERSIKVSRNKDGGMVYADDAMSDYAKFVHMGQRTWKPDEFIYDSHSRNERILDQRIDKAIDDALRKAGI